MNGWRELWQVKMNSDVLHAVHLPRTEDHQQADVQWGKSLGFSGGPCRTVGEFNRQRSRNTESLFFCFAPAESEGFPSQEHACFSMSASKGTREQRVSVWSGRTPSLHLQAWGGLLRSAGHSASPLVGEGREGQRGALPSPLGLFLASLDDLLMSWVKDRRAAGGSRSRECHRAILSPPPSTDTLTLQLHTEQFPLKEPQELVKQLLRSWWAKLIRTGRRGWDTLSQQTPLPAQQPTVRAGDQQLPDAPWGGEDLNPISASQLLRPVPERCTHTPKTSSFESQWA